MNIKFGEPRIFINATTEFSAVASKPVDICPSTVATYIEQRGICTSAFCDGSCIRDGEATHLGLAARSVVLSVLSCFAYNHQNR